METSTSIGQSGTVVSMVVQLRGHLPADIGTVAWFAYSNAHISPFIPCYFGSGGLPPAYSIGALGQFDPDAAWWVFQELGQLCYRNYAAIANQWIIPITRAFENDAMAVQPDLDAVLIRLYEKSPERARRLMRTYVHAQAAEALETARRLSAEIKGRYLANTVIG